MMEELSPDAPSPPCALRSPHHPSQKNRRRSLSHNVEFELNFNQVALGGVIPFQPGLLKRMGSHHHHHSPDGFAPLESTPLQTSDREDKTTQDNLETPRNEESTMIEETQENITTPLNQDPANGEKTSLVENQLHHHHTSNQVHFVETPIPSGVPEPITVQEPKKYSDQELVSPRLLKQILRAQKENKSLPEESFVNSPTFANSPRNTAEAKAKYDRNANLVPNRSTADIGSAENFEILRAQILILQQKNEQLQEDKKSLQQQQQQQQQQIEAQQTIITQLQHQLSLQSHQQQQQQQQQQSIINQQQLQIFSFEQLLNEQKQHSQQQINSLSSEVSESKKNLKNLEEIHQKTIQNYEAKISKLQDSFVSSCSQLKLAAENFTTSVSVFREQNADLSTKVTELEQQLQNAKKELEQAQNVKNELKLKQQQRETEQSQQTQNGQQSVIGDKTQSANNFQPKLFFSMSLLHKLSLCQQGRAECANFDVYSLYDRAVEENIPPQDWSDWIWKQISIQPSCTVSAPAGSRFSLARSTASCQETPTVASSGGFSFWTRGNIFGERQSKITLSSSVPVIPSIPEAVPPKAPSSLPIPIPTNQNQSQALSD